VGGPAGLPSRGIAEQGGEVALAASDGHRNAHRAPRWIG
jgi:hypothetical protein